MMGESEFLEDEDFSSGSDIATIPEGELAGDALIDRAVQPVREESATDHPGRGFLREVVETVLLALLLFVLINTATGRFRIEGQSMLPGLTSDQYILINKIVYKLHPPRRGDVVVFHSPREPDKDLIKRVIGLPGETVSIQSGQVFINGYPLVEPYVDSRYGYQRSSGSWVLGPDDYFVMGDNRSNSSDSRRWGPLDRDQIIGKAWFAYWPPGSWPHRYSIPHYHFPDDLALEGPAVDGG